MKDAKKTLGGQTFDEYEITKIDEFDYRVEVYATFLKAVKDETPIE